MSSETNPNDRSQLLDQVIEEYTAWFMLAVKGIFYPAENRGVEIKKPGSFAEWLSLSQREAVLPAETLLDLESLHNDLSKRLAEMIQGASRFPTPPPYKNFSEMVTFFEEFMHRIRRIEKDGMLQAIRGIDPLTGLRSPEMVEADVSQELHRMGRNGKPLCLAIVRIDRLQAQTDQDGALKKVADFIKKSIRSFDDAYRLEEGEFLLMLKQTTMKGGTQALHRIKTLVTENRSSFTVSSCICEPLPDDKLENLMKSMRSDLDMNGQNAILEHKEMSALERFLKEQRE